MANSNTNKSTQPGESIHRARSYDSNTTDEGYHTDEKPKTEDQEIPILTSSYSIRISYSPLSYTLIFAIIITSLHVIFIQPRPWSQSFPPIFALFHLSFHLTHLFAHQMQFLGLERHCVVYGTWLYWTGWLLSKFLFSQRLAIETKQPITLLFWLLMIERRNAWGMLVWEYVSRLDQNIYDSSHFASDRPLRLWELGSFRLLSFRIWCLLGTGSFWGLLYTAIAKMDGYTFGFLLQAHHVMKLLLVSTAGGLMMIAFWSFWTFQYRGVLWQQELRKGIIVWYSEGVAHAAQVH